MLTKTLGSIHPFEGKKIPMQSRDTFTADGKCQVDVQREAPKADIGPLSIFVLPKSARIGGTNQR